jgi:hypothetical protein
MAFVSANIKMGGPANNWKKNTGTYTGDDLIDAFIKGKQAALDKDRKG